MKRITILPLMLITVLVALTSCTKRISSEDITADNFNEKLKPSTELFSSADFGLPSFMPWGHYTVPMPQIRETNELFTVEKKFYSETNFNDVVFRDKYSGTIFHYVTRDDKYKSIEITGATDFSSFQPNSIPNAEEAINHFLKEANFSYKTSSAKNSPDILIKADGNGNFLVGHVYKNKEGAIVILQLGLFMPK